MMLSPLSVLDLVRLVFTNHNSAIVHFGCHLWSFRPFGPAELTSAFKNERTRMNKVVDLDIPKPDWFILVSQTNDGSPHVELMFKFTA